MADIKNLDKVKRAIEELLAYAEQKLKLNEYDVIYARNQLLEELNIDEPAEKTNKFTTPKEKMILPIINYAINDLKKFEDTQTNRLLYETKIFGFVTPAPSQVCAKFDAIAANVSVEAASDYLFDLSKNTNYIRMIDIDKNEKWQFNGQNGQIQITINLSKPEKDPKEIALAKTQSNSSYPHCVICKENLGFKGNLNKVARQTLRFIPLPLNEEKWHMQYSPYQYYNHHIIVFDDNHKPMAVDKNTFVRLFDFVDLFPQFFLGSNAALPIVGGSILAHDHYQGGAKVLPMMKVHPRKAFLSEKYQDMEIYILDWYNSVIRIKTKNKKDACDMGDFILKQWQKYSNEKIDIISETNGTPHNAITPIARLEDGYYILDLILRNNRCNNEKPDGIFHPGKHLHNIKKEGIGIIEVMGLFILPGRLKNELEEIANILTKKSVIPSDIMSDTNPLNKHLNLLTEMSLKYQNTELNEKEAKDIIKNYVNRACEEILYTTAVFKHDELGEQEFNKFMIKNLKLKED